MRLRFYSLFWALSPKHAKNLWHFRVIFDSPKKMRWKQHFFSLIFEIMQKTCEIQAFSSLDFNLMSNSSEMCNPESFILHHTSYWNKPFNLCCLFNSIIRIANISQQDSTVFFLICSFIDQNLPITRLMVWPCTLLASCNLNIPQVLLPVPVLHCGCV